MSTVKKTMDAVIVTGEYQDQQGNQKKKYMNIGTLFVYQDGGMSLKLDAVPLGNGNISFYDKKHLFRMAGEHEHYSAGNQNVVINYKGWRIRLLVCYDLRFPVWSRNTNNYDLLIYVANWPKSRIFQWNALLTARAIENQAYVVGVNRIGEDGNNFIYSGSSQVINPKGVNLINAAPNQEFAKTIEIDYNLLAQYRENFPVTRDADDFVIN